MAIKLAYLTSRRWQKGKTMLEGYRSLVEAGIIVGGNDWWVTRQNADGSFNKESLELNGQNPADVVIQGDNLWLRGVASNGDFVFDCGIQKVKEIIAKLTARQLKVRNGKVNDNGVHFSFWIVPLDPTLEKAFVDASKAPANVAPVVGNAPKPPVAPVEKEEMPM